MIDNTTQQVTQSYVQGDDLPQIDPAADLLDTNLQARKLAQHLLAYRGRLPFTVGIFGEWGEGKTTFVNLLYQYLRLLNDSENRPTLFVNFSAWPYTTSDKLWRALVLEIAQVLYGKKKSGIHPVAVQGGAKATTNVAEDLSDWEATQSTGLMTMLTTFFSGDALELWRPEPPPDPYKKLVAKLDDANYGAVNQRNAQTQLNPDAAMSLMFRSAVAVLSLVSPLASGLRSLFNIEPKIEVAELLNKKTNETTRETIEALPRFQNIFREMIEAQSQGQPVYVFIDDLDRCQPDIALDILESIRIALADVPCVFIIAVDERLIAQGLRLRYKELFANEPSPGAFTSKGQEYLEKIIQFRLRVPSRTAQQTNRFIAAQFPLWATAGDIIQLVAGTNPRRLKQYCQRLDFVRIVGQSPFALGLPVRSTSSVREADGIAPKSAVSEMNEQSTAVEQDKDITEDLEHLHELGTTYQRRLRALEIQAATLGTQTPPNITMDIEDIRQKLAELEEQERQMQVQEVERKLRRSRQMQIQEVEQKLSNLRQRLQRRESQLELQGVNRSVAVPDDIKRFQMEIAELEQERAQIYGGDASEVAGVPLEQAVTPEDVMPPVAADMPPEPADQAVTPEDRMPPVAEDVIDPDNLQQGGLATGMSDKPNGRKES